MKGLTQEQLARKIGTSQKMISRYELGKQLPGKKRREKIAAVLGKKRVKTLFPVLRKKRKKVKGSTKERKGRA